VQKLLDFSIDIRFVSGASRTIDALPLLLQKLAG
jgi:hypothetical protein